MFTSGYGSEGFVFVLVKILVQFQQTSWSLLYFELQRSLKRPLLDLLVLSCKVLQFLS